MSFIILILLYKRNSFFVSLSPKNFTFAKTGFKGNVHENMGKGKLAKFADMAEYPHVFEYPYSVVDDVPFEMKGNWNRIFQNDHRLCLNWDCGRGEYTVGLAPLSERTLLGRHQGARMWTGATDALKRRIDKRSLLRTNIEIIDRFFAPESKAKSG